MQARTDGEYWFRVCDLCERDSSNSELKEVYYLGLKGICDKCLEQLAKLLKEVDYNESR